MATNPIPTFVRVDPETLAVTLKYNTNGGAKWADDDLECTIPFDILADQSVLVDDVVTLQTDPIKVQAKLDAAWTSLRSQRNALLAASDWVALADAHLSQDKKDAWFTYRQALRDLPDECTDPLVVDWPPVPGSVPVAPVASSRFGALLEHAGEEPVSVPEAEPVPDAEPVVEVPEPVPDAEPVVEVPEPVPEAEPVVEVPEPVPEAVA